MKALNYWWLYAFGRAVLAGLRRPLNGLALLKGYMSKVPEQYGDIKDFVLKFQKKTFMKGQRMLYFNGRHNHAVFH